MSAETIDIAKLTMINATTVALLVVASLSYWMGKRSVRVEYPHGSRLLNRTLGRVEDVESETADGSAKRV